MSSGVKTILLAVVLAVLGALDYLTGPDIGFSLFYLIPIAYGSWYLSRNLGIGLALLASACWVSADFAWHGVNGVSMWNGFVRLGIYLAIAWLTSRVRHDSDELHEVNDQLRALLNEEQQVSRTDVLTGLPNRRMLLEALRGAISQSQRTGTPLAVAYIDVDRFKPFNDRQGHAAGNALLKQIAAIVSDLPSENVAARLGSDDFAVLLGNCTEGAAGIAATALHARLAAALAESHLHDLGVSIGVAYFDTPPGGPEALIDCADAAMYCARARNNSVYVMRVSGVQGRST